MTVDRGTVLSPGTLRLPAAELTHFVARIFEQAGSSAEEAGTVASHLVQANLVGHDSHGIMRVVRYLDLLGSGKVVPNQRAAVVTDKGAALLLDGQFGYGQVAARDAMTLASERAREVGLALVALRNAGHLGRIGAWAEMLADQGLVSLHFVNSSGFGILVAPHGGSDRRLSSNPIAAGLPIEGSPPVILDFATSVVAEGKIQMALNKGEPLPPGSILDGEGRPTTDPSAFYADPPGVILPFGAHKGSALSILCEALAGSLTGGGAGHPANPTADRLVNNMVSLVIDPASFVGAAAFGADLRNLTAWVKTSRPQLPGEEVLLPGEIEQRTRREREANGIPVDPRTWHDLLTAAARLGVGLSFNSEH